VNVAMAPGSPPPPARKEPLLGISIRFYAAAIREWVAASWERAVLRLPTAHHVTVTVLLPNTRGDCFDRVSKSGGVLFLVTGPYGAVSLITSLLQGV